MITNPKHIIAVLSLVLPLWSISAQADDRQWLQISGRWTVDTDKRQLADSNPRTINIGYNELINMNSVSSAVNLEKITKISSDFELFSPMKENKAMLFFASSSQKSFYAVKFTGTQESITTMSLIQSSVKDSSLSTKEKNNFTIEELASVPVSMKWGELITLSIELSKKKIKASALGFSLNYQVKDPIPSGDIGFSHSNNLITVKSIKVWSEKKVIFEDDFSKNRLKKVSVNATKVDSKK
jgi:hypothetical protein